MSSINTTGAVVAAAATGTAAVIVFALLPVISGAMTDRYGLHDTQIGEIALSYFSVYALVALSSGLWIRKTNWIYLKHIGFLGMAVGLVICVFSTDFSVVKVGLAVTGVSAGILFPISLTLVSDMEQLERNYAIKLSAEQLIPAGVLFLFATTLFAGYGQQELILAIFAVIVLCWLSASKLPANGTGTGDETRETSSSNLAMALISLVALCLNFAGFAGLWAFMERLGNDQGFEAAFINTWLGVGLITSGIGPLGAAIFEDRFGRLLPLIVASCTSLLLLPLLAGEVSSAAYMSALTLLPLAYYFSVTYMFAVVADADHNGKMAGQMSFALAVGAASGPAIFGIFRASDGPVLSIMGALMLVGAIMMVLVQRTLNSGGVND